MQLLRVNVFRDILRIMYVQCCSFYQTVLVNQTFPLKDNYLTEINIRLNFDVLGDTVHLFNCQGVFSFVKLESNLGKS